MIKKQNNSCSCTVYGGKYCDNYSKFGGEYCGVITMLNLVSQRNVTLQVIAQLHAKVHGIRHFSDQGVPASRGVLQSKPDSW